MPRCVDCAHFRPVSLCANWSVRKPKCLECTDLMRHQGFCEEYKAAHSCTVPVYRRCRRDGASVKRMWKPRG